MVVLRWLQVWNQCPVVCLVVPESEFFHSKDCVLFGSKGVQGCVYRRILHAKAHLTSPPYTQFDFYLDLRDF